MPGPIQEITPGFHKRVVAIDLLKHLTTLSLGAIAIVVGFLRSLLEWHGHESALILIVSGFFVCIIASVIQCLIVLIHIEKWAKGFGNRTRLVSRFFALSSIVGFTVGATGLFYFALSNILS